jgi:hypothetical protein
MTRLTQALAVAQVPRASNLDAHDVVCDHRPAHLAPMTPVGIAARLITLEDLKTPALVRAAVAEC